MAVDSKGCVEVRRDSNGSGCWADGPELDSNAEPIFAGRADCCREGDGPKSSIVN